MSQVLRANIPQIFITLASPKAFEEEPHSPFSSWLSPLADEDDDTKFRRNHLTPPPRPIDSPRLVRTLSPSKGDSPTMGEGLERQQFERLLKLSERASNTTSSKKPNDLRREIALRAHHQARHQQRRALFLAKLTAPPSPTAIFTPTTPPESPGIFHYSLPSPGLNSPLAMFDQLESPVREPYMVEVDYRRLGDMDRQDKRAQRARTLPSLEEITARMNSVGHPVIMSPSPATTGGMVDRLPAFLRPQPAKPLPTPPMSAAKTEALPQTRPPLPSSPSKCDLSFPDNNTRSTKGQAMLATLGRRTHDRRKSSPAELQVLARDGFSHAVLSMPGGF